MKNIKAFVLFISASLSISAHAGFISGNHILTNGKSVELQGLEWMPFTYTAGLSRRDIEDGFTDRFGGIWGANDWRYATRSETETLLGSLWDKTYDGFSSTNYSGAHWFLSRFGGLAFDSGFGASRIDGNYNSTNTKDWDFSYFFFGADGDCVSRTNYTCLGIVVEQTIYSESGMAFNVKTKQLEVSSIYGSTVGFFGDKYGLQAGQTTQNSIVFKSNADSETGSLLVRVITVDVPSPTVFSLLGLGLCALVLRRRINAS